ncbi:MAG: Gldg family protein [Gemmatimonadetes bacterium]|nr:Gldg family protein [Gemmatimonadota bacterium]
MMRSIWTIARRELRSYFDHATAYILLVIFLVINFFFFFRDAYLLGEASLRPMLGLLPWLLLFFVPAVCMRSLAEEREAGTLELVLAQPVEVVEFLLGKFLGVLLFLLVAMAGTLGVPLGLSFGADIQVGVAIAQYFGSALLIAALVAVGLWASSLTRNQVTAFILGVTIAFVLYMVGLPSVVLGLPSFLAVLASRLGILGHFESVTRGVIDLRDVLYFAAVTAAFLALTYFSLMRERLSRSREAYGRLRMGTAGMVAIAIFAALAGSQLRGRVDLTPGQLYTLSSPTEDLLGGLDDLVTIKFFRSAELPPELTPLRRDIEDLLRDFDAAGGANVNLIQLSPDDEEEAAQEASLLGIDATRFNVIGQDEMSFRDGYLGLAIQYAGESDVIPLVRQTYDLEYRLASMIRGMTQTERSVVALLTGHGEFDDRTGLTLGAGRLGEEYTVQPLALDSTTTAVPDSIDVVVIAGGTQPLQESEAQILGRYLDGGGSLLVLQTGVQVDQQSLFAGPLFNPALDSLLSTRGLGVVPSIAYDLRAAGDVQVRSGLGFLIIPYPLWIDAQPASDHAIVSGLGPVTFQWGSPLQIEVEDSTRVTPLLTTTDLGGRLQGPISIDPNQDWQQVISPEDVSTETLAVAYTEPDGGRIVLVGTPSFIEDGVLRSSPNGLAGMVFFQNAVDWLAQDEALISIRSKDRSPPQLLFSSEITRDVAKYANLIGVPLLFVLFGIMRLARRRRVQTTVFERGGALV